MLYKAEIEHKKSIAIELAGKSNEYLNMSTQQLSREFQIAIEKYAACSMPYEKQFYEMKVKLLGTLSVNNTLKDRALGFWFAVSVTEIIAFIIYLNFL